MEEVGATHHLGENSCPIVSAAQLSLPEGGRPQHLRLSEVAKEVSSFSGYSDPMLGFNTSPPKIHHHCSELIRSSMRRYQKVPLPCLYSFYLSLPIPVKRSNSLLLPTRHLGIIKRVADEVKPFSTK